MGDRTKTELRSRSLQSSYATPRVRHKPVQFANHLKGFAAQVGNVLVNAPPWTPLTGRSTVDKRTARTGDAHAGRALMRIAGGAVHSVLAEPARLGSTRVPVPLVHGLGPHAARRGRERGRCGTCR